MNASGATNDVLVANPGSVPEVLAAAVGLASVGRLRRYCVPLFTTPKQEARVARLLPKPLAALVLRELRRRNIPPAIPEPLTVRLAGAFELASVMISRAPLEASSILRVIRAHHAVFDKRVARQLDGGTRAVVAVAGAAERTLGRARERGITGLLDCPTPHHSFIRSTILEEASRHARPVSDTLLLHDFDARFCRRLDRELELADRVFVLSSFQRETYLAAGVPEEKLMLTPLGVDLDLFRPAPRLEDGVFRVIFVGAMTQRKGISYLLDAMRMADIPASELLCVGRPVGSVDVWLRHGIRYIRGPIPRVELPPLYSQADVYVLPSLIEGFPQTALEAMACGLPVILSQNTFANDVITDGTDGYVVPIRDSAAIADRLLALYRDPALRHEMGRAARMRAEEFSWETYGRRVVNAIDSATAVQHR